jgi:hypothetical protein
MEKSSAQSSAQSSAKIAHINEKSSAHNKRNYKRYKNFECKICAYITSNITNHKKHLKTKKHLRKMSGKKEGINYVRKCKMCEIEYTSKSSYYRHKRKCTFLIEENKKLKMEIMKQENKNLKNLNEILLGQLKTVKKKSETVNNITNSNNVINNQNTNNISINMYLNEHCKNAMNLTDFVKNIQLQLSDIIPESNYIDCVSNILIKNLKDLQPTERPIHCCDAKRLQFYVKDGETWEKDVNKIDTSIDDIHTKQYNLLHKFDENNKNNNEDTFLERQKIANIVHEASLGDKKGINDAIKRKIKETVDFKMNIEKVD